MRHDLDPPRQDVRRLVEMALAEDLTPFGDLSATLLAPGQTCTAEFVPRSPGVIAGTSCVIETFAAVDPTIELELSVRDGERVEARQVIATARGPFASVLTAERTALNFLSHLSGIATNAATWVDVAAGRVTVWDTRKTLPGYRSIQKAAVRAGGAANHRGNLSDWIMIKDNHLLGTTITEAVAASRRNWPGRTVHVEADRRDQVDEACDAGADIILCDNFSPVELIDLVAHVNARCSANGLRRPLLEASGGITFATLDAYAGTGVDLLSSGSLTNSAPVLDIGLDVVPTA